MFSFIIIIIDTHNPQRGLKVPLLIKMNEVHQECVVMCTRAW